MKEREIGATLVQFVRVKFPDLLFFHIPNGGARDFRTGAQLKKEGVLAGAPDYFFAIPPKGLFLEIKTPKGVLSRSQKTVLTALAEKGFNVKVAWGIDQAIKILETEIRNNEYK